MAKEFSTKPTRQKMLRVFVYALSTVLSIILALEFLLAVFFIKISHKKLTPYQIALGSNEITRCNFENLIKAHPYLEYFYYSDCNIVDNPIKDHARPLVLNKTGQISFHDTPLERDNKFFDILLLGGSVASDAFLRGIDFVNKTTYLESELNKKYYSPNGRPFRVFAMAYGGWKYPNQFIAFSLYSSVFSGVITLDGYNESHIFMLQKNGLQKQPWFFQIENPLLENPTGMYRNVQGLGSSYKEYIKSEYTKKSQRLRNKSYILAIIRKLKLEQDLKETYNEQSNDLDEIVSDVFSAGKNIDQQKLYNINIEKYRKYLRMMNAVSNKFNIKEIHFIQPAPALYKELTEEEIKNATHHNFTLDYGKNYLRINNDLITMRSEGVPIYSLLKILKSEKDSLYIDEIHLNKKGNKILVDNMIKKIAETWKLKKKS